MKKLKVMTVVGTRPEIIRLARVIPLLDLYCDHVLVHTGQNYDYELNEIFFDDLNLRSPDHFLKAAAPNGVQTIGKVIIATDELLKKEKPDAVLVLGDTNSCMSIIAAKRRKIPTFHMEAGNRCFDMRVPEEINRKIVDHVADVNLPYSAIAREYLLSEGLSSDLIVKTGSPMNEVLSFYKDKIEKSDILKRLGLSNFKYFVISVHREENIQTEENFRKFVEILNHLANQYKFPVIVSTHPRTKQRLNDQKRKFNSLIRFEKPLPFTDYNKLQISAKASLSDSGTINEESSLLNFPALNLRGSHERPEGMEEAAVMMVGFNKERMVQGLSILNKQKRGENRTLSIVEDYRVNNVAEKVVRIIHSYTDYVNNVVWKK